MLEPEPQHYQPEDFKVGESVNVYGREIFLYDCDDFTRDFFKRYAGLEQQAIPVEDSKPVHVKLTYPPHTGFGTEEDSMASCLALTPKAPRRDIHKLMGDQGKVLRFQGSMMNGKTEDANRRFVVGIYLADDSVGVWELRQRNSGHAEGKFALKGKKKNPATGTWYCPMDFQIGDTVEINCVPFLLVRADDSTLTYMEKHPKSFPASDIRLIGKKLISIERDLSSKGEVVTPEEVQELLKARRCMELSPHEMVTLRRQCGLVRDDAEVDDDADDCFDAQEAPG